MADEIAALRARLEAAEQERDEWARVAVGADHDRAGEYGERLEAEERLAAAEAQVAEADRALIACQEEIADLRQRIRDERREHEHTQLNRAGASAQADGLAKALIACQERCNRLAEALRRVSIRRHTFRDDSSGFHCRCCGNTWADGEIERHSDVCLARAALAEHDAAKGEG